jgi:hypothetical protein
VRLGDIDDARRIALPILAAGPGNGGTTSSEALLSVSLVLLDILRPEDLGIARSLLASDHQEVRTKALQTCSSLPRLKD